MDGSGPGPNEVDWHQLDELADRLSREGTDPASISAPEWHVIDTSIDVLLDREDWAGLVRMRNLFTPLVARDTAGAAGTMRRLADVGLQAARACRDTMSLADFLGADGHNLHRQGYHREAIVAFEESAQIYTALEHPFEAKKSFFMTALCHRALGDRRTAKAILKDVLMRTDEDDPWRSEPLQVTAWIAQDEGGLDRAGDLLTEAIRLEMQRPSMELLLVGSMADLGEVRGLQGRIEEARECFQRSLELLAKHSRQYNRLEARTFLKMAELETRLGSLAFAAELLDRADDDIRVTGGYHDLMWRIELARAVVFFRQRQPIRAFRKLRSAYRIRHSLGLSNRVMTVDLVRRLALGLGLPR